MRFDTLSCILVPLFYLKDHNNLYFYKLSLSYELETKFLRMLGTWSTLLRVSSLLEVNLRIIFPCPSTFEVEELPINNCSPLETNTYDENIFLLAQIWGVAPVSTHHSLEFPTKLHSKMTAQRLRSATPSNTSSITVIEAWAFLCWKFFGLRQSLNWSPILLQL